MKPKKLVKKNMFAIGVDAGGDPCAIGRVDSIHQLRAAVERNEQAGLTTFVLPMNLSQIGRVVRKIMVGVK